MANSRVYLEQLGSIIGGTFSAQNPHSISASVQTTGSVQLEAPTPTNESTGWYYVELQDSLYTTGTIYKVIWSVVMVSGFPTSTLTTRFYYNATATNTYVYVQNAFLKLRSQNYKLFIQHVLHLKNRSQYYKLFDRGRYYLKSRSSNYKLYLRAV